MLAPKIVAGMQLDTCLADNKTKQLWQQFKPHLKNIPHVVKGYFYSIEIYTGVLDFKHFSLQTTFKQWAAVEIEKETTLPAGIEVLILPGGLYAAFIHKGTPATFFQTVDYIHNKWLPESGYSIDERPHFEVMDENYDPTDELAEEQVFIPIIAKKQTHNN